MPKLYEYFGLGVYFYANEHEPVHVHGFYQGRESKAEIVIENGIIVGTRILAVAGVRPLTGQALAERFKGKLLRNYLVKLGKLIANKN